MSVAIPSSLQEFVEHEVATGAAGSEEELVTKALELYRQFRQRHVVLKAQVDESLAEAERGEIAPLDIEAIISRGTDCLASEGITD